MNIRVSIFSLTLICLSNIALASITTPKHPDFIEGVNLAKNGKLLEAKYSLEKAKAENYENPKLFYNLGVVNYKLAFYDNAKVNFLALSNNSQLNQLAFYNLALVELKLKNEDRASYWLNQTIITNNNNDIRNMAVSLLGKIQNPISPSTPVEVNYKNNLASKRSYTSMFKPQLFQTSLKTDFGYNDNVAQYKFISRANNDAPGDSFASIQGDGRFHLNSNLYFIASAYYMAYKNKTHFNSASLLASANYRNKYAEWNYDIGSSYIRQTTDTKEYQTITRLHVNLNRDITPRLLYKMLANYDLINILDNTYEYLGGNQYLWQHKLQFRHKISNLSISYQYEHRDRNDYESDDGISFTSFSPRIHQSEISATPNINHRLRTKIYAAMAYSYHNEKNFVSKNNYNYREDFKYYYGIVIKYKFMKDLFLSGKYTYIRNQSSLLDYQYRNALYQLGVSWNY